MFKVKLRFFFSIVSLSFFSNVRSQNLIINELSNGPSGSKEYVELLVVGAPTCNGIPTLDLRGYYIDDNNGAHASGSGTGIADGCYRFKFDPFWSNIPIGTLILIYNDLDYNTNIGTVATPLSDLSMSDGNCRLIIPISNTSLIERHTTLPSTASAVYPTSGLTTSGIWGNIGMANTADSFHTVDAFGNIIFAISWGNNTLNTNIYVNSTQSGKVFYMDNSVSNSYTNQANWTNANVSTSGSETPGLPNNVANAAWISSMNNSCSAISPFNVSISSTNASCSSTGSATVSATGAISPYTYTWSLSGGNGTVATGLAAGLYSVSVTSSNGCLLTQTVSITSSSSTSVTINTPTICSGNLTILTATPSSLGGTYLWSPGGQTTQSISVSPAVSTTYSVDYNLSGCVANETSLVNVNPNPTISVNNRTVCSGQSATLTASGASSYTFSSGSNVVTPLTNTSYSVIGTSALGCVGSNTAVSTVTVYSTPSISLNSGAICSGNSFTITPSGASSYTYSSGSNVVSPLTNTSYSVTGTSSLGCVGSNTAVSTVTVNATPIISVNSGSICSGNSFTITPSGASSYTYSSGSNVVSPTTITSYTVTGASALGCTNTAVSTVSVNGVPIISVNSGSICSGNSFTIIPSGASSYTYSSGSNVVTPLTNTSYSVIGTSALGCVGSNTAVSTVTVYSTPSISLNSGAICSGNSFTITPSGANTYTYLSGSSVVSPTTITNYTVTGTSALGCTNSAVSTVTVNGTPSITINSGAICSGNSFTLIPSGANTYTYSSGSNVVSPTTITSYTVTGASALGCTNTAVSTVSVNGVPIISVNNGSICSGNSFTIIPSGASSYTYSSGSNVVNPLTNTSYSITGTSALGCVGSNTAVCSVTVNATPIISVNSGSICSGNSFTMIPSGANTYTYSSGSNVVSPTTITSYTVTGTSALGCVGSNTAVSIVSVNGLPIISVNSGSICSGNSFTITPSGASTYTYSSGSNVVSPTNITSYTVTGASAIGCTNTAVSTVNVNGIPNISVNSGSICLGNSFTITPIGASSYTYSSGSNLVSPTAITSYTITGASALGCTNTAISTVSVNGIPNISVNSGSICLGNSFTITPSGASTYTYSSGSNVVSPTNITSYTVTGTSASGCTNTASAVSTVSVNGIPIISVNSGSICSGNSFTISPSGANTYTYSSGSNVVSPLTNTFYSITGTSALGCVGSNTAISIVTVNSTPSITINSGVICSGKSFTLIPSGANTYTYSSGTNLVSPLTNTSYSVTGTSALGCVGSNTAVSTVTVNATPSITVNSGIICAGKSFTILPSGANTYTYSSGTNVVSPLTNTSYSVTGTSALGCVGSNTAVSTVTVNATPSITVNSGVICSGNSFTITPIGANTFTYSSGSNVVSPTTITNYTVTGVNILGCTNIAVSTVSVNGIPNISVNSGVICTGNSFTLIPSGAISYTYSSGSNVVSPTTTSSYTVTGASAFGCTNTAVSTVSVNAIPIISVNSGSICSGNSFTITPSGASSYTYSSGSNVVNPTTPVSYTVTGANLLGCTNTAISTVFSVMPLPTPSITANTNTLCLNQKLILQGFGGTSYYWLLPNNSILTSQTMSLIAYNSMYSGTYTLIVRDANACVNSTTKKIKVENLPSGYLIYNNGLNNCVPFCNNYTFVPSGATTTLSSSIQQFNWQINNQSVSSQNTFSYCFINAGTYIVKGDLTSDLGCTNSVTMQIIGYPKPMADFTYSPKHPIENMEEVSFVSSGKDQNIKNFNWIFMYNKTEYTSNQINPSFLFENAGTYSVALIVTNEYECKDTVIKTIRVASDFAVYVPNSFTPNEDNKNDTFNAVTRGVKIYSLFIFDRWGHQIFETTDLNTGWDGTFKGQSCPSDIYVWKIYATSTEGVFKELTGHLMLYP